MAPPGGDASGIEVDRHDPPEWFDDDVRAATDALWSAAGPAAAALTTGVAVLADRADPTLVTDSPVAGDRTDRSDGDAVEASVAAATATVPAVEDLVAAVRDDDRERVVATLRSLTEDADRRAPLAAAAAGFPSVRDAPSEDRLARLRDAVGADDDRTALARVVALGRTCRSRSLHRRLAEWCGRAATAENAAGEGSRAYRLLDRALSAAVTPPDLEADGFLRLSPLHFADGPEYDPITYWRTGFTLRAVRAGLVYRFGDAETELTEALAAGADRAVVGAPGSGKSVLCRCVAVDWYEADRGTVLYGEQVTGDESASLDGLRRAIERGTGHVLVVVDGLSGAPGTALANLVRTYADGPVSFLFAVDRSTLEPSEDADRVAPGSGSGPATVFDAGVDEVEPPSIDEGTVAGVVERFEATTGNTVTTPPAALLEQVRSGDAADRAGDAVRLAYRLVAEAGESATEMEAAVASAHERVREAAAADDLVADVALLVNVLSAAGLPVFREYLRTLDDDHEAVEDAVATLDGVVLFRGESAIEPNHDVWAALYLRELVRSVDEATAHERFARVVNALFGAFDPAVRERVAREDGPDFLSPLSPPASLVATLVDLGVRWPVLAPLYGTAERSLLELPSVCSTSTVAGVVADRGEMYFRRGDTDRALSEYERAWELVDDADDVPARLRERNHAAYEANRGKVADRRGNLADAASYYERALTRYRTLDDRRGTAGVLLLLGRLRLKQGDYDAAETHFEESADTYRDMGAHRETARALNELGITAWEQGDTDAAEAYLRESLSYNRRLSDRRGAADCLHKLGMVDYQRGGLDDAREKYERSLRIRRTLGDRYGQAATLNGLGNVALEVGDYDEARDCFEEALAEFRAIDDVHGIAAITTSLGNLEIDSENYEAARAHFADAVELFEEIGDDARLAEALNNLGNAMLNLGKLDAAEEYCRRSLERKRAVGDAHGTANTLSNLGRIERRRGNLDAAREYQGLARRHFEAKDSTLGVAQSLTNRGAVEREAGDHETALSYYEDGLERYFEVGAADAADDLAATVDLCVEMGRTDRAIEWCRRGVNELDGEAADRFRRRLADLES